MTDVVEVIVLEDAETEDDESPTCVTVTMSLDFHCQEVTE